VLFRSPDPTPWWGIANPGERLRTALAELYAWYRETEPMTAHVLRDKERLPVLGGIVDDGLGRYLDAVRGLLAEPFEGRGGQRQRVDAAVRAVTDFHLWEALAPLGDVEAAELAARLVEAA